MKPTYSAAEARYVLSRWAFLLVGGLVLSLAANMSFSRYLIAQREGDPDTHLNRAETLMAALDLKGAKVSVENAMDRAPLYPRAHKVLGDILFKEEHWQEAENAYQECLNLHGTYPGVQNNILWAMIMQEKYDQAIALGRQFLAEKEHSRLVPRYVAEACFRGKRWQDAYNYLGDALDASPKDRYLLDLKRQVCKQLGLKDEEDRVLARMNALDLEQETEQPSNPQPLN